MAAITRSYSIVYGALTFANAASGYSIDGPISPRFSYRAAAFEFNVIVHGSSASDLETKCTALISEIRKPRQNLVVTMGTRVHTYSQAAKTGWDQVGIIEPEDASVFNTHTTREYSITISVITPAILAGDDGISDYGYSHLLDSAGMRRFTVTGTITTNSTIDAEAQYEAKIAAIVTSIKSDIDSTANWTELTEERGIERFDFEMNFTRSYVERIFKDSLSDDDIAAIREADIQIIPSLIYDANASPDIARPIETTVTYSAVIDSSITVDLMTVWEEHSLPLIKDLASTYAATVFGNDQPTILEITPTFSPTGNLISGMLRMVSFGPQRVLSLQLEEEVISTTGVVKVGVYGFSPYQRARLPGQATAKVKMTCTAVVQGSRAEALAVAQGFTLKPTITRPPGEILRFPEYKLLTRLDASKTGGAGGDWSLETESQQYIGPVYAGTPPIPVATCVLVRVFDYDEDLSATGVRLKGK